MHTIDALTARRVLLRPFVPFFFVLLSWFVTPHAHAVECPSRYAASGAYPADPMCPLKAAAADFGGMGGYVCGDPSVIASYCSGPSATDTTEPVSPEGSMPDDPDNCAADATAGCGSSTSGGEPVNLYTGQFYFFRHDLALADTLPLDLARTYRSGAYDSSGRPLVGAFGVGGGLNFDTILAMSTDRQRLELRQATGIRVPFTPRAGSSGKGWDDLTSPGEYYRARIDAAGTTGLTLTLRDGRIQRFTSIGGVYRLSRLEDRNGNAVVIARDSSTGAITSVSGPNGRTLTFTSIVGARGTPLISRVTDPLGRQVSYTYDSADRLVQVSDAAGGIWKYGWDSNSRLAVITDPEGNLQVASTYDGNDRVIAQKLADGSTFAFAYTLGGGKATQTDVTDRRGSIRRVEFDANGRVVRNTYPLGDATQQVQTFTYDATGRVTNLAAGDRQYAYGYDTNGNRISEADQYGTLHTRTHDSYSQVLTDAEAGDPQRGVATVYTYDAKGNLLTVTDRLGNRTTFTVDAQGRVLTVTDALKGVTRYTYTGGDLTAVTDPLNRTTQYTTDAAGRVTAVQDPLGNRTKRTLDALDRTTDITDALNGVTRFTWDRNGHLLSQSDPKGVTTRYTYNAIGRPVSKTDPLGRSETYTWTSAGQLASVTDRKGQVTTYRYDAAGRLTRRELTPPGGDRPMRTQNYGWDAVTGKFQITSQSAWKDPYFTDNAAVLMVKPDPVSGKVASVQEFPNLPGHQTQQFGYAPDSRDLTRVVLNDATVDYMRDAEHRITQAQYTLNDEAPKTFTFAYDALGRRSKATLGNGIAIGYTWDAASQLTGITYGRSDGTTIGTLTYTYDAAGRRTGMGGSLAKTTLPQPVADAQYNGANQLTRWAGKTFTYDANGSLTGDGVNRYGWGVTGEFSQIDSADGSSIQYQYDVLGRRKRMIANGSRTTDYLNVGDDLALANTDDDWSHRLQQFPLFVGGAPDELLMRRIGDDPATDRYVLRDANNNVIALTDAGQNIVTQYRYEPYGQTTQSGAADANPQQYTGRENDGTGLYFYRNRYYHPATGRFISEDPIGYASGQTNAYAYVGGNPVQFSDPSGLQFAGGGSLTPGPYVPGGGFGPRTPGSGSQGLDDWLSNPSGGTFADSNADDPVVYPNNPDESAERFKNIPGTPGKQCLDGSVWERDKSGHGNREGDGSQWKRWPNRKSWENGRTPQSIWPDGRIRK